MDDSIENIAISSQFSSSPKDCENKDGGQFEYTQDEFAHDVNLLISAEQRAQREDKIDDEVEFEEVQPSLIDLAEQFTTKQVFHSLDDAQEWIVERGMEVGVAIIRRRSDYSRNRNPYVKFACSKSGTSDPHTKGGVYVKKVGGKGKSKARHTFTNKCNCPFLVKCKMERKTGLWSFHVSEGSHNHPLFKYEYGHPILGRLTVEEKEAVKRMARANTRPKNMLAELKDKNPRNFTLSKQLYNVLAQFKKAERDGRSIIQEVFNLAESSNCFIRHTRSDGKLENLFWSHNESISLARNFPYVFMMDCTYKTNQYKMALLQIIGVTSTNKSFSAAFALLSMEREANYVWALQMLKEVLDIALPSCVVTDKELALINAVRNVFPDTNQLICRWHIQKAVESNAKVKYGLADVQDIVDKWAVIENSPTEDDFNKNWAAWKEQLIPEFVTYLEDTWIKEFKTMFISAWTDKYFHLGNTCTSRVESVHAVLKNWLGSSNINLVTHWHSVQALVKEQIRNIQATFEDSTSKIAKEYASKVWCRYLFGSVSHHAIELMKREMDEINYAVVSAEACGCSLRTTHGLPCVHEMKEILKTEKSIPLSRVHIVWRTLCAEGPIKKGCGELDYMPLVNQFIHKFENCPWEQQFEMLERLREVIDPRTTTLQEPPIKVKTKGRPKGSRSKAKDKGKQDECSTKRDHSFFEHVDRAFAETGAKLSQTTPSLKGKTGRGMKRKAPQPSEGIKTSQASVSMKSSQASEGLKIAKPKIAKPLLSLFHPILQPYVEAVYNVDGDGNCGFRCIAVGLGRSQNDWAQVRMELLTHLNNNKERYFLVMRDKARVETTANMLDWKEGECGYDKWLLVPYTLWLICDYYNVALSCISTLANYTYLPISQGPPDQPKHIWMANFRGNHFVVPTMSSNCPLPVISHPWQVCCNDEASKWQLAFGDRFKEGERLFFPDGRPAADFHDLD